MTATQAKVSFKGTLHIRKVTCYAGRGCAEISSQTKQNHEEHRAAAAKSIDRTFTLSRKKIDVYLQPPTRDMTVFLLCYLSVKDAMRTIYELFCQSLKCLVLRRNSRVVITLPSLAFLWPSNMHGPSECTFNIFTDLHCTENMLSAVCVCVCVLDLT